MDDASKKRYTMFTESLKLVIILSITFVPGFTVLIVAGSSSAAIERVKPQ